MDQAKPQEEEKTEKKYSLCAVRPNGQTVWTPRQLTINITATAPASSARTVLVVWSFVQFEPVAPASTNFTVPAYCPPPI